MSDEDFIIHLFCRVDDRMRDAQKHSQATLYPSEVVTLALLFSLKGKGNAGILSPAAQELVASVSEIARTDASFVCSTLIGPGLSALWLKPACSV